LDVPNGFTIDGGGYTITATDPAGGHFMGAVLASAGTTMNVRNLTIQGHFAGGSCQGQLTGIYFHEAGGAVSYVTITGMTQGNGCQRGLGLRGLATTAARTIDVTGVTIKDFQKSGIVAGGDALTINVTGSTIGPPDYLPDQIAANSVQLGGSAAGTGGTLSHNTIIGSGTTVTEWSGTGVLLWQARDVEVSGNTIESAPGATPVDAGIMVAQRSSGIHIAGNTIAGGGSDGSGIWVVDPDSANGTTVVGNTVAGFATPLVGDVVQPPHITTASLPAARVGTAYRATLKAMPGKAGTTAETVKPGDPDLYPNPPAAVARASQVRQHSRPALRAQAALAWSVTSGHLPGRLRLDVATGTIAGTPAAAGRYTFTVQADQAGVGVDAHTLTITVAAPNEADPGGTPGSVRAPGAGEIPEELPVTGHEAAAIAATGLGLTAAGALVLLYPAHRRRRVRHARAGSD
jgi:hypothetical protein